MSVSKKKDVLKNRGRNRAKRPKTFKIKENAEKYAKELGKECLIDKLGTQSQPKYRVKVL